MTQSCARWMRCVCVLVLLWSCRQRVCAYGLLVAARPDRHSPALRHTCDRSCGRRLDRKADRAGPGSHSPKTDSATVCGSIHKTKTKTHRSTRSSLCYKRRPRARTATTPPHPRARTPLPRECLWHWIQLPLIDGVAPDARVAPNTAAARTCLHPPS